MAYPYIPSRTTAHSRTAQSAIILLVLLATLLVPATIPIKAQEQATEWELASPDGRLRVTVFRPDDATPLAYRATYDDALVIADSPLGLTTPDGVFDNLTLIGDEQQSVGDAYTMATGKRRARRDWGNQRVLRFITPGGRQFELVVRAYNDGVALRYVLPDSGTQSLAGEHSGVRLPQGTTLWTQPLSPNYEQRYVKQELAGDLALGTSVFPLLYTTGEQWVLLSEAGLGGDYAAAHLAAFDDNYGLLRLRLPNQELALALPWASPWRVALVGPSLNAIVGATLIDSLSPPAAEPPPSWIKPGRVAWSWWSDGESPKSLSAQQEYVDFATTLDWEYVLVDEGWSEAWMPELVAYARARGIGIVVWARWTDLDSTREREERLGRWKRWGVAGVKVDFMDSDAQARMAFYEAISEATYRHRLLLNFHGATLPRGQQRRWPHIMSYEAVYGAEYYKWNVGPTPAHNAMLPFTRNVVGSMDYTPVTFSARRRATTDAHELALAVVFESGWQHFADTPRSYGRSPGRPLLRAVPTVWDDTVLLGGYPGEWAALARRAGRDWFLGVINGDAARTVELPLDLLGPGNYRATTYRDGASGTIVPAPATFAASDTLQLDLPPGGGWAAHLVAPPLSELPLVPRAYLPLIGALSPSR